MTAYLVDRSSGQIRALSLYDYGEALRDWLTSSYFVAWSESAARCQQRAIFREVAKISLASFPLNALR